MDRVIVILFKIATLDIERTCARKRACYNLIERPFCCRSMAQNDTDGRYAELRVPY